MALAALLGALTVASSVSLMALSAYLVSLSALHPSVADLGVAIVAVRFFGLARGVGRYLERYVSHTVTFRILTWLRVWFYSTLEPLAPARLMQFHAGDLLGRAVGDIETLQEFFVRVLAPPAVALLVCFGICTWLWSFSPQLALAVLGGLLLTGVLLPLGMGLATRAPARLAVAQRAVLNTRLVDTIQGAPDIVAYGQAQRFSATIRNASQAHAGAQSRFVGLSAFQSGVGTLLAHGTAWVVLVLSIGIVNEGIFSGVYLAALMLATAASFEAVLPLPAAAQALQLALNAARRLFAVVDVRPAVSDPVVAQPLPTAPSLTVRDLRFAYAPDATPALAGISFAVEPGRRIAIVGPSGAGKSTLVYLLMRFWDYAEGEITLGGTPLNALKAADVRSVISLITQQPYLFNGTIYENLRIARPEATRANILQASAQSQLHDFVNALPQGYDTRIGERGAMLSGGERQRLAIARVLLRNTPIVALDEPTANLDAVTERHFLQSLFGLMQGRTLLLITHRLVCLDQMDEILVMQRGRIVERGTQADLLREAGLYYKLWLLQNERLG